jgi:hypothetical protein
MSHVVGDYTPDGSAAGISELATKVDERREALRREHEDLGDLGSDEGTYRAAAKALIDATSELLAVEDELGQLRTAELRRQFAARRRQERAALRRRLWLIIGGIAAAGAGVVALAGTGVVPGAVRIPIGAGVVVTSGLMAYSMTGEVVRAAGVHAINLPKAVAAGCCSGVAVIGALSWPLAGLAVFPAIGVAAIPPLVGSAVAGRERASELEGRPGHG